MDPIINVPLHLSQAGIVIHALRGNRVGEHEHGKIEEIVNALQTAIATAISSQSSPSTTGEASKPSDPAASTPTQTAPSTGTTPAPAPDVPPASSTSTSVPA